MTSNTILAISATNLSGALALAVACRRHWSFASGCFCFGMILFAAESALTGLANEALLLEQATRWLTICLIVKSFLPGVWLTFSVTYSRGDYRESLKQWWLLLIAAFLVPVGLAAGIQGGLIEIVNDADSGTRWIRMSHATRALNGVILVGVVLILMNLERTFRSAVGTMRWRIKFLVLGLAVIFGTRIYTRTQALLIPGFDPAWSSIEAIGLLFGCSLIAVGYVRRGFEEVDVYPSREVLQSSLTMILVGTYLFVVGVLAKAAAAWGETISFPLQAALVFVAVIVPAILLLSDRARGGMRRLVSHHFKRPEHDSRKVWARLSQSTSEVLDRKELCTATARLISQTFSVLSVTVWLLDDEAQHFQLGTSTALNRNRADESDPDVPATDSLVERLRQSGEPFDLDGSKEAWVAPLKQLVGSDFRNGGHRVCVPLVAGDHAEGIIILADRVRGVAYTMEEMELLKCIGDQIAANLLNLRLTQDLLRAKEMESFLNTSAFFVHDLKNTVSSMNLMVQNLPVHFDDPEFRDDALRVVGNSAKQINSMIERLSALRQNLEIRPVKCDLNQLVIEAVASLNGNLDLELIKELRPLPMVMADEVQLRSVVINLLLNAREATSAGGVIRVETGPFEADAVISIADNGCGMSPAFVRESLFRPFRSTKKKGLGIGLFQSKSIVEAHRGRIQVESEPGRGTTFRVHLPLKENPK